MWPPGHKPTKNEAGLNSVREHAVIRKLIKLEGEAFPLFRTFPLSRPRHCGEFCITVVKQIKQNVWVLRRLEVDGHHCGWRNDTKSGSWCMAGDGWAIQTYPNPFSSALVLNRVNQFDKIDHPALRCRQGHFTTPSHSGQCRETILKPSHFGASIWTAMVSSREAWTGSSWAANHVLEWWCVQFQVWCSLFFFAS